MPKWAETNLVLNGVPQSHNILSNLLGRQLKWESGGRFPTLINSMDRQLKKERKKKERKKKEKVKEKEKRKEKRKKKKRIWGVRETEKGEKKGGNDTSLRNLRLIGGRNVSR